MESAKLIQHRQLSRCRKSGFQTWLRTEIPCGFLRGPTPTPAGCSDLVGAVCELGAGVFKSSLDNSSAHQSLEVFVFGAPFSVLLEGPR